MLALGFLPRQQRAQTPYIMKCLLGSPGDTARRIDTKPLRRIQWLAVVLPR